MDPIARFVDHSLRAHAYPALRLDELVSLVGASLDRGIDGPRLLSVIRGYPSRFRILEPAAGPWTAPTARPAVFTTGEAWVAALDDPDAGAHDSADFVLRESVRWLGHGTDARSIVDVARWHAIALAQRDATHAHLKLVA